MVKTTSTLETVCTSLLGGLTWRLESEMRARFFVYFFNFFFKRLGRCEGEDQQV